MVALFLVDGFEEIEALATVDILRRGGLELVTVSLMDSITVLGAHGIEVKADKMFDGILGMDFDMLILPGGGGTFRYNNHLAFLDYIKKAFASNLYIAAICAAPTVLGGLGILKDKRAVCFPGLEEKLFAKEIGYENVIVDGKIITSKAAGTTFEFALKILEIYFGQQKTAEIKNSMLIGVK